MPCLPVGRAGDWGHLRVVRGVLEGMLILLPQAAARVEERQPCPLTMLAESPVKHLGLLAQPRLQQQASMVLLGSRASFQDVGAVEAAARLMPRRPGLVVQEDFPAAEVEVEVHRSLRD